jgi:DNA-binding NtrC family response regulator
VLVVDDEAPLRDLLQRILSIHNYRVRLAANAREALRLVQEGLKPDLVILDMVMPEITGDALGRRLHRDLPEAKLLYISGYPKAHGARFEELESGVPFVAKPFRIGELMKKVREALGEDEPAEAG